MSYDKTIYNSQEESSADIADLMEIMQGHHLGWTVIPKEDYENISEDNVLIFRLYPKNRMTMLGAKILEKRVKNMVAVKIFLTANEYNKLILYTKRNDTQKNFSPVHLENRNEENTTGTGDVKISETN